MVALKENVIMCARITDRPNNSPNIVFTLDIAIRQGNVFYRNGRRRIFGPRNTSKEPYGICRRLVHIDIAYRVIISLKNARKAGPRFSYGFPMMLPQIKNVTL